MSQITRGMPTASQGSVIAGGVWAHSCALGVLGVVRGVGVDVLLLGTCFMLEASGEED